MVAIGLLFGNLTTDHYEADVSRDPCFDALRLKMVMTEDRRSTGDYHDPEK